MTIYNLHDKKIYKILWRNLQLCNFLFFELFFFAIDEEIARHAFDALVD